MYMAAFAAAVGVVDGAGVADGDEIVVVVVDETGMGDCGITGGGADESVSAVLMLSWMGLLCRMKECACESRGRIGE